MKNTNTEAVRAEMEKILTDRANEIATLQGQIDQEAEAIEAAKNDMQTATDAGDLKAYQDAKSRRADAADAKEMHESRMKRLTDEALITETEYNRMKADIFAEMDMNTESAKKQLKRLCDQISSLADDLRQAGQESNSILKAVQRDLYGNFDRPVSNSGTLLGSPLEYKRHYDVLGWANHCLEGEMYKTMLREETGKTSPRKAEG